MGERVTPMETASPGRGGDDLMGRWQDPTLPRIVTSCWKRSPLLLPFPQFGSGPVGEKCWENPLAQPEGGIDAGRGSVAAGLPGRCLGRRAGSSLSLSSCCNHPGAIPGCSSGRALLGDTFWGEGITSNRLSPMGVNHPGL